MDKRIKRLQSVPDEFLKRLDPIQREVFKALLKKLGSLETKNGVIVSSVQNMEIVDSIREFLHQELLSTNYPKAIKDFADEFTAQSKLSKDYFDSAFNVEFSTQVADQAVKQIKTSVVRSLVTDSVQTNFLTPLENTLMVAVNSGASFAETVSSIRDFIEGNDEVDGRIVQYSKQIAHDSFANSDRAYNSAISDELGIEWFLWAGGEVAGSRCFCIERHGKYYHYKEIEAWGRGENIGACETNSGEWAGRNRSTNEQTIFTYAGGYGCLHTVAGVSIFSVPKEDVLRNVQNGNYRPTQTESDFFGF